MRKAAVRALGDFQGLLECAVISHGPLNWFHTGNSRLGQHPTEPGSPNIFGGEKKGEGAGEGLGWGDGEPCPGFCDKPQRIILTNLKQDSHVRLIP
jgi:hypothetical protein